MVMMLTLRTTLLCLVWLAATLVSVSCSHRLRDYPDNAYSGADSRQNAIRPQSSLISILKESSQSSYSPSEFSTGSVEQNNQQHQEPINMRSYVLTLYRDQGVPGIAYSNSGKDKARNIYGNDYYGNKDYNKENSIDNSYYGKDFNKENSIDNSYYGNDNTAGNGDYGNSVYSKPSQYKYQYNTHIKESSQRYPYYNNNKDTYGTNEANSYATHQPEQGKYYGNHQNLQSRKSDSSSVDYHQGQGNYGPNAGQGRSTYYQQHVRRRREVKTETAVKLNDGGYGGHDGGYGGHGGGGGGYGGGGHGGYGGGHGKDYNSHSDYSSYGKSSHGNNHKDGYHSRGYGDHGYHSDHDDYYKGKGNKYKNYNYGGSGWYKEDTDINYKGHGGAHGYGNQHDKYDREGYGYSHHEPYYNNHYGHSSYHHDDSHKKGYHK